MTKGKVLIIIPTYNEKENIKEIIEAIFKVNQSYYILVVDDNSPDKTWQIIKRLQIKNRQLHLIKKEFRQGLGPAYISGFLYALKKNFDYVVQMDSDFSHEPKMIPQLISEINNYDWLIGSRYVKGGNIRGWDIKRRFLSWLGNSYTKLVLGFSINDWTSGFSCWKKDVLEKINLNHEEFPNGYAFLIALKYKALLAGFKPKEIPITFKDRQRGVTKMGGAIINEAILTVLRLRLDRNRLKENGSRYRKRKSENG